MSTPLTFSVLLPVYNAENFVGEAVQSILDQSFEDFELLLLNDGSTDESLKVLESFNDPRIRIINNAENLGLIATLNKGIKESKGLLIARMDADDIAVPVRLEKQFAYSETHPDVSIFGANGAYFGGSNLVSDYPLEHDEISVRLLFENPLMHPTVVIKRSIFEQHDLKFDKHYIHGEDWALWIDAYQKGLKFGNLKDVLLNYRLGDHNITIIHHEGKKDRFIEIYKKVFSILNIEPTEPALNAHYYLSFGTIKDYDHGIMVEHYWNLHKALNVHFDSEIAVEVLQFKTKQFIYRSADVDPKKALSFARKTNNLTRSILAYIVKKRITK